MPAKTQADINENLPETVSVQAAALGTLFGFSIAFLILSVISGKSDGGSVSKLVALQPVALYAMGLSVFHFLEYYITAKYNSLQVTSDSFLINHSGSYTVAHTAALTEALFELYFFPQFKLHWQWRVPCITFGVLLMSGGQWLRSIAMKTAGESFSHIIATQHRLQHRLVTTGVYRISRHPSYTGYFWWAIGSQLLLCNPICFIGFCVVLYRFFKDRIEYEEKYLVSFFGDEYVEYRKKRGVYIPFLK